MTEAAKLEVVVGFTDKCTAGLKKVGTQFDTTAKGVTSKVGTLGTKFKALGASIISIVNPALLAAGAIAGMGVAAKKSISAFADFEDAMAGVKKTTGMSDVAIRSLGDGIKGLTKVIPLAHTELANIAAVAGQLGIQGKANILDFTNTASMMATAFDMPAEKAATVAAKLTNIYKLGVEQASNLASAINVLGNTTAASESQISDYAMSLGAAAVNMGFSATEAVSMGASLIAMGMDASDAGTRLNAAFTQMGQKTAKFAEFLELTEDSFKDAFGKAPMEMVIAITNKISEIEDPLERAKVSAELFGRIGGKAMTGLGADLVSLQKNLDNAAEGFKENTSLEEEFAAKTDTLKAKFQLLRNALNEAAITIGTSLAPYVEKLTAAITTMVPIVMALGGGLKDLLSPAFKVLGAFLNDIIPQVKALAEHFMQKLQPAFESVKNIATALGTIFGVLTSDLDSNEDALLSLYPVVNLIAAALNLLAGMVESVVTWFAKHPEITKSAAAIAAAAAMITIPIFAAIDAIGKLSAAWDSDWLRIKTTTLTVIEVIKSVLVGFIAVITAVWETLNTLKFWIDSHAAALWNSLISATVTLITAYLEPLINTFAAIYNWFARLTGIQFSWPNIPNPFAGIDFCKYIPGWLQKWLGICDQSQEAPTMPAIPDPFENTFDSVKGAVGAAEGWGASISNNFAAGISSGAGAVSSAASAISRAGTVSGGGTTRGSTTGGGTSGTTGGGTAAPTSKVSGLVIDRVGKSGGDAIARGNYYSAGVKGEDWDSRSQDGFSEIVRRARSNSIWFSSGVWNAFNEVEKEYWSAHNSILGVNDGSKVIRDFVAERKGIDIPETAMTPEEIKAFLAANFTEDQLRLMAENKNTDPALLPYLPQPQSFSEGGPVGKAGGIVHDGEYVVPKAGSLVSGGAQNVTIHNKYDIGNVYGVDDLQRVLDAHDKRLLKKLEALV